MAETKAAPNILLLMADQLPPSFLPAHGNKVAKSPCLDDLAERGIVFDNAYCNYPLCAPSRSSFMTGKLCSDIGAYDNGSELPAAVPTISHYLRTRGYRTAISGKTHFVGPDQMHGVQERLTPDICSASLAWTADWQADGFQDDYDTRLFTDIGCAHRTAQIDHDEETTFRARGKLYDWADLPLFSGPLVNRVCSPFVCHHSAA